DRGAGEAPNGRGEGLRSGSSCRLHRRRRQGAEDVVHAAVGAVCVAALEPPELREGGAGEDDGRRVIAGAAAVGVRRGPGAAGDALPAGEVLAEPTQGGEGRAQEGFARGALRGERVRAAHGALREELEEPRRGIRDRGLTGEGADVPGVATAVRVD